MHIAFLILFFCCDSLILQQAIICSIKPKCTTLSMIQFLAEQVMKLKKSKAHSLMYRDALDIYDRMDWNNPGVEYREFITTFCVVSDTIESNLSAFLTMLGIGSCMASVNMGIIDTDRLTGGGLYKLIANLNVCMNPSTAPRQSKRRSLLQLRSNFLPKCTSNWPAPRFTTMALFQCEERHICPSSTIYSTKEDWCKWSLLQMPIMRSIIQYQSILFWIKGWHYLVMWMRLARRLAAEGPRFRYRYYQWKVRVSLFMMSQVTQASQSCFISCEEINPFLSWSKKNPCQEGLGVTDISNARWGMSISCTQYCTVDYYQVQSSQVRRRRIYSLFYSRLICFLYQITRLWGSSYYH